MKKFIIFIILSLINVCMYGTDTKEVIVRKSGLIYRKTDDKLIKLDDTTITVKLKRGKAIDKNLMVVRSNCLGYYDISVPKDVDIEDFVDKLRETGNYEIVKYNVIAEICMSTNDTYIANQWYLNRINMFSTWDL